MTAQDRGISGTGTQPVPLATTAPAPPDGAEWHGDGVSAP